MDNDYAIWRAFDNNSWPALYFVDARGRVRQHHFGEGEYEQSEKAIQRLLAEAGGAGVRDGECVKVEAAGVEAPADLGEPAVSGKLRRLPANGRLCIAGGIDREPASPRTPPLRRLALTNGRWRATGRLDRRQRS